MSPHGVSFDVEDWHQLVSMRTGARLAEPSGDVDGCVSRILDLCDEVSLKATFFVLGLVARARPGLIRRIADRGHEIASHSVSHRLVHTMTFAEILEDMRHSKMMLEDIAGHEVVGYRAPEFSVQRLDHPCFEALLQAGFRYDSSVFPIANVRYGISNAPHAPFTIKTASGALTELPLATTRIGACRIPIAGGSHFRVLPTRFVTWAARRADAEDETLVFYFHPYEFSKQLLYVDGWLRTPSARKLVILHNLATGRIERSLRALCKSLQFVPLRTLAAASSS